MAPQNPPSNVERLTAQFRAAAAALEDAYAAAMQKVNDHPEDNRYRDCAASIASKQASLATTYEENLLRLADLAGAVDAVTGFATTLKEAAEELGQATDFLAGATKVVNAANSLIGFATA